MGMVLSKTVNVSLRYGKAFSLDALTRIGRAGKIMAGAASKYVNDGKERMDS